MTRRTSLAITAAILLSVMALPVLAQDTITYEGHDIEPEAALGPVQCVVWERDEVRHEDPNGVTMEATVTGVILIDDVANGWIIGGRVQRMATGAWDAKVGDDCTGALGGE